MSAIAGVIRLDGGPVDPGTVAGMIAAMAHRGPDATGHWHGDGAALGHAALHTTPEQLEEAQPLVGDDGALVLVMDGRVDNRQELRADLLAAGARLDGDTDSELVLAAYRTWDTGCLDRIDGDFALVIRDSRRHRVFCARDRMGARPFYYHHAGARFAFASELHALLALPWVEERFNEGMVAELLAYDDLSRTETFWHGILRLDAATATTLDADGARSWRYWVPAQRPEIRYRRMAEYAEHYREIFTDSVRRHSRCHVGIACEVSGGLDSSSVFAAACRLDREGRLPAPDVEGYSLHFGDGSRADEIAYARAVGTHLGRPVREIPPALPPLDWYRDWARRYRDFPHYPNTVMGHSIHRTVREDGRRVILTGYGGDEWQMGSPYYLADYVRRGAFCRYAAAVRREMTVWGRSQALYRALRFGPVALLPAPIRDALARLRRRPVAAQPNVFRLSPALDAVYRDRRRHARNDAPPFSAPRHELSFRHLYSPTRAHTRESFNLLASSAGVETRDPMTSTAMVEFHFRTPDFIRQNADEFRICHRTAMQGALPEIVLNRDNKADFSSTIRRFVDELPDFECNLLRNGASLWLHQGEVDRVLALAGKPASPIATLWALWGLFGCALLGEGLQVRHAIEQPASGA